MDHNFDMEAVTNDGSRAVHLAAIIGHINILQWLMDNNIDMEAERKDGSKAVHLAAQNGHIDIIQWLTDHKFNLEVKNNDGSRAVHYAAYNGHIDILQWLMNHNCDMEAMNNNESRAVHYAGDNGHKNIVKWLKDNKCDMSPRTNVKTTSFDPVREKPSLSRYVLSVIYQSVGYAYERIGTNKSGYHLGAGGFGTVSRYMYKSFDFAIKTCWYDSNEKGVSSVDNEITINKMLPSHPRIVQYFGTIRDNKGAHMFMEPMMGGSLENYIKEHGPLDSDMIAHITKQILEGLDHLHSNNIIHRDIKCANILRDTLNNIKISDFGTSRDLKSMESKIMDPTQPLCDGNHGDDMANTYCGSTYWMAPGVIRGEPYSTWADVWSLGATVVEMLTGMHPYPDLTPECALYKISHRSILEYAPPKPISAEFQAFIDLMLFPDPQQRATVKELLKSDFILAASDQTN